MVDTVVSGAFVNFMMNLYNNNNHDNVYGAVILTKVIAKVHPVHLINED